MRIFKGDIGLSSDMNSMDYFVGDENLSKYLMELYMQDKLDNKVVALRTRALNGFAVANHIGKLYLNKVVDDSNIYGFYVKDNSAKGFCVDNWLFNNVGKDVEIIVEVMDKE